VVDPLAVVQVCPVFAVTVYLMIGEPLAGGAIHDTVDWPLANEVAVTPVGAPGVAAGMAGADGLDAGPVPAAVVAVTVKV